MAEKTHPSLTRAQVEAFATGLYYVACTDGLEDREKKLIAEFVKEAGAPELVDRLDDLVFDPVRFYRTLETEWIRRTFLKTAILLVRADGRVSPTEKATLNWLAKGLGLPDSLEELEKSVEKNGI